MNWNTLFNYIDGKLYWRNSGKLAGYRSGSGYIAVTVDSRLYIASRIIWEMFNSEIPPGMIVEHRDENKLNNNLENLRLGTHAQNMQNRGKPSNNTSGYKGVTWHERDGKWRAQIKTNGSYKQIGSFTTPELAYEAYCKKAKELHGEFFHN
jgi:hypothetical protein